jgi:hypothetical protein
MNGDRAITISKSAKKQYLAIPLLTGVIPSLCLKNHAPLNMNGSIPDLASG